MNGVAYGPTGAQPPAIWGQASPVSPIGQSLSRFLVNAIAYSRSPVSDWRPLTNALIEEAARAASFPNWDGYGASPVRRGTKEAAQRFVDLLPYRLPAPDTTVDPEGDVTLVWDFGPGHVFGVSIGAGAELTYAGRIGEGVERHGLERLDRAIPKSILESLDELCERAGIAR